MATTIRLGRKTPAAKIDILKQDAGLWAVLQELEGFLATQDLRRLTAEQVADFLVPRHPTVNLTFAPSWYEWVWSEQLGRFIAICHYTGTVSVRGGDADDPILVDVDVSATYE